MSAAPAAPSAEARPFSPGTLSLFSQLLSGYNLNAGREDFEVVAQGLAVARAELAAECVASGMVPGAGPNAIKADVDLDDPDLPGLTLVEDAPPANRAARRAKPPAAKAPAKRAAARKR